MALSLRVVLTSLPRTTPFRPICRISRSTVQRATSTVSRPSWRQTLRAPYTHRFSSNTRPIASRSTPSRRTRGGTLAGSARRAACV
jgi:hypothetical protein